MSGELPPGHEAPALPEHTPERLSGRRKAAVLLAALGSEHAAGVIQHLADEEIEGLSAEIAKLSAIAEQTAEAIMAELVSVTDEHGAVSGGVEMTRELLERALGSERATELLARLAGSNHVRPFEFLRRTPPEQIGAFLRTESPQTAALVLANLPAGLAAQVLSRLPQDVQPEVAVRIARMGEASAEVIHHVEEIVRQKLTAVVQQEYASPGGVKSLADILGHTDRSTERAVLDHLSGADGDLAEEVRRMLFVFEDIIKLEDRAIQQVLREADQKDLVLALRGAPEAVKQGVLSNMSERGAAMLQEELEIQQPQRKRDVDAAQGRIVAVVRRLEEAGTIVVSADDGEGEPDVV